MIWRILILIGLGWLLLRVWRGLSARWDDTRDSQQAFQPTVRCTVCQVHLPRERAVEHDGKNYCDRHAPPAAH